MVRICALLILAGVAFGERASIVKRHESDNPWDWHWPWQKRDDIPKRASIVKRHESDNHWDWHWPWQKRDDIPIYATGYWRDNLDIKAALEAQSGKTINILTQEKEMEYEAGSVMAMLKKCGLKTEGLNILTVGTGKGSSQWVLYEKGVPTQTAIASGYSPHDDQQDKADAELGTKDAAFNKLTKTKPDLIVGWGALWYIVKGKGGLADHFKLDLKEGWDTKAGVLKSAEPGKLTFIPEAYNVSMLVVRNIVLPDDQEWKAHWDIPSAKYIDLGSGKAARVDSATGKQEAALKFDNTDLKEVSTVLTGVRSVK